MRPTTITLSLIISILGTPSLLSAEKLKEPMPLLAKPGQCFTKAFFPPEFTKTTRSTSTKRVLIRKESIIQEVIPAKYEWVEQQVKISDGSEKIITTPARYKTVYEKVLIKPAYKVWRTEANPTAPEATHACVQAAINTGIDLSNVEEGSCLYEHFQAAKYQTTTQKILASEAAQKIVVSPARYRTVIKKIETDSTTTKLIPIKAKYKHLKDKVVVAPARMEWQKTTCQNRGCNQAEVVCLTEVPTKYKEITRKVLLKPSVGKTVAIEPVYKKVKAKEQVSPARTQIIPIPATYQTIEQQQKIEDAKYFWSDASQKNSPTRLQSQCNKICLTTVPAIYKKVAKKLLVSPAQSQKVTTPPQYTTVKVKKIIEPARFKKVIQPAEYKTVTVERERTKGYSKWMPIVCESNMTPTTIRKVQEALKREGFYHGEIHGIWDQASKSATRAYQKANGLTVTRLSIETMEALGIY